MIDWFVDIFVVPENFLKVLLTQLPVSLILKIYPLKPVVSFQVTLNTPISPFFKVVKFVTLLYQNGEVVSLLDNMNVNTFVWFQLLLVSFAYILQPILSPPTLVEFIVQIGRAHV